MNDALGGSPIEADGNQPKLLFSFFDIAAGQRLAYLAELGAEAGLDRTVASPPNNVLTESFLGTERVRHDSNEYKRVANVKAVAM